MSRLARRVFVTDADGKSHSFEPGDTVPDWAVEHITNPRAWEASDTDDEPADDTTPADPSADDNPDDLNDEDDEEAVEYVGTPPPKGGSGSGTAAWADYAAANGVQVADDASRDDIVAALDDAGVPTEPVE